MTNNFKMYILTAALSKITSNYSQPHVIRCRIQWKRSGCLCWTIPVEPALRESHCIILLRWKKQFAVAWLSMYICDVASGFNFQIGHFLHLYRVEREKVTLRYIIWFRIQWRRSGSLVFNDICWTYHTRECLRHRSALKKKQFVVHQSKQNSDCADITKIKDEKIQIF